MIVMTRTASRNDCEVAAASLGSGKHGVPVVFSLGCLLLTHSRGSI